MSLRKKINSHPMVSEFGLHDDSVPDYKYFVLLKDAYWHPIHMGRYHSATSLQGIADFIDGAEEKRVETLNPALDRYGMSESDYS